MKVMASFIVIYITSTNVGQMYLYNNSLLSVTLRTERRSGVFIVNFEHTSHLVLVFLLLTLNM